MLSLNCDIAEGEFKDYYLERYRNAKPMNESQSIKWGCIYRVMLEGDGWEGRFKAFMTSLEESNPRFKYDPEEELDERKLLGLKFGGIFREEEYQSMMDGSIRSTVKIAWVRSTKAIEDGDFRIPAPKKLLPATESNFGEGTFSDNSDLPF